MYACKLISNIYAHHLDRLEENVSMQHPSNSEGLLKLLVHSKISASALSEHDLYYHSFLLLLYSVICAHIAWGSTRLLSIYGPFDTFDD